MSLARTCLQCGHISQTCSKWDYNSQTCDDKGENSIMLFGVQLTVGTNNNKNNNNLSQYQPPLPQVSTSTNASNVSDNDVHASARSSKCNRGNWTEEEHKMFLKGLKDIGKGKWKEISTNFVKTRTPTQVASHAQKYYLLHSNHNRRRGRKASVFDLTISPLPTTGLGPAALQVWPLSWVDLNDNISSSSGHLSPSASSSTFNSMLARKSSGGNGDRIGDSITNVA